jgi:hypothetical protein
MNPNLTYSNYMTKLIDFKASNENDINRLEYLTLMVSKSRNEMIKFNKRFPPVIDSNHIFEDPK